MSDNVIELTDATWQSVVAESTVPVLVDFWAPWCGPCRTMAPVLEDLSKEWSDKIKVCKINVDENAAAAAKYGIQSIPTLCLFKDGAVVKRLVGARPLSAIKNELESEL